MNPGHLKHAHVTSRGPGAKLPSCSARPEGRTVRLPAPAAAAEAAPAVGIRQVKIRIAGKSGAKI